MTEQLARTVRERMAELARKGQMDDSIHGLERKTDISYETCRTVLRGVGNPSEQTLKRLADGLGLPLEQLREEAGKPERFGPWEPPPGAELLTPRQRRVVEDVIAALLDASGHQRGAWM